MIYFLRHPDGFIKIGTTTCLMRRLAQLRAEYGADLDVMAILDGGPDRESRLHLKFADLRGAGEWFRAASDLLDFIERHARPWQPADDGLLVRLPAPLVEQARAVAAMEGATLVDVVAGILGPALAVREQEARERRAAAVGLD